MKREILEARKSDGYTICGDAHTKDLSYFLSKKREVLSLIENLILSSFKCRSFLSSQVLLKFMFV